MNSRHAIYTCLVVVVVAVVQWFDKVALVT